MQQVEKLIGLKTSDFIELIPAMKAAFDTAAQSYVE